MTTRSGILPSVQAAGKGIVIEITGDGESAKRALEMVQEELRRTAEAAERTKSAGDLSRAFDVARQAVAVAGLTVSVEALGGALRSVIGDSLELGETLEKASIKTGLAVETLSVLHYATAITGDSFEGLTRALTKMNVTIGKAADGDAKASASMQALGLDAKELSQRTDGAEIAFNVFMKRLGETEGSIERTNLATRVMSKAGAEQIPVILKMAENWDVLKQKAQEAGVLLDSETAKKLADTSQRLNDLKQQVTGAGLAFTEGMVPGLNQMMLIISAGKGDRAQLIEWGHDLVRVLAGGASAAYSLAAGFEYLRTFGISTTDENREAIRNRADTFKEKAEDMRDLMLGDASPQSDKPFLPNGIGSGPRGAGFEGAGLGKPGKSDNPIAQAGVALAQEQAKLTSDVARAAGRAQLAEWETQHKLLLASDLEFYKAKLDIANKEYAAEQISIDEQTKKLEALQKKQHGDKLLKRDKDGNSAEELKTARELVQLQEKQTELTAKKLEAESRYNGEVGAMNNAAELAGLRAAAALERERGQAIEAQIKLLEREHELEAQKSTLAGGSDADAQAIRDSGVLAVHKLQLQQVEQGITRVEQDHRRAVEDTNDAVEKGDLSKRSAAQQIRVANAQELQELRALAQQYKDLAAAIGDPTLIEKAKDLDEQLATLGRTDRRGTFGKEVQDGLQGITTSIIDSAARGKQSFADMARSILDDLDRLALKLAEEKFIVPLFEQAFGGAAGGAKGGAAAGNGGGFGGAFGFPSIATEAEAAIGGGGGPPSVYKPQQKSGGGFLNGAIGLVGKIATAAAGGHSKTPAVTSNIINNSSQPVTAGQPQVTWDTDSRQYIIETVLENHLNGGALSQI